MLQCNIEGLVTLRRPVVRAATIRQPKAPAAAQPGAPSLAATPCHEMRVRESL